MRELPGSPEEQHRYTLPSELVHDLRTPLNQIIGYSELLVEQLEEAGHDEFVPYLEKVRAAGHQLLSLINDNFLSVRTAAALEEAVEAEPPEAARIEVDPEWRAPEAPEGRGWGSVLVVDEVAENRDSLSELLRHAGYHVVVAENGERALDLLDADAFDLVLLDVSNPALDGYEVLRRLKSDDRLRDIPVITITTLGELDSVTRCLEMGAEDYLLRPFYPTLLQARVGARLEKKRARDRELLLFQELQESRRRLQALDEHPG